MKRALFLLLVPVSALALAGTACGVHTTHKSVSAVPVEGGTGWTPATPIKVPKGDKVVIRVGNDTKVTHGFSIDAFRIKQTVEPGKHIEAKFTPTRTGTFVVYCQLHPAHKKTALIVS
jgi:nitrosocyanin